jgi:hypothetical protein
MTDWGTLLAQEGESLVASLDTFRERNPFKRIAGREFGKFRAYAATEASESEKCLTL